MQSTSIPGWALVIPWDPVIVGGVSQVVINVAKGLKERGAYNPVVIVEEWTAARPRFETRDELPYIFTRMRPPPERSRDRIFRRMLTRSLASIEHWRFLRLLRDLNIQVLNFHYPWEVAEPFVRRPCVLRGRRVNVVFSIHGNDIIEPTSQDRERRDRFVQMLARGDAIVAPSQGFADIVTRCVAPELSGKVRVIHNGVSQEALRNCEITDTPIPARYILNAATFEERKGQRYLLEAFSQIADEYPDLHLILAGRAGPTVGELDRQVSALGLQARVHLLLDVPHSRIGALFASAAVFCLSSLAEPFGIVLLEAGVFGIPVIATRTGGVPEIIRDKFDGLLVAAGNAADIASALRAVLGQPDRAAAMGANLRDRVLSEFSWNRTVERYIELASTL